MVAARAVSRGRQRGFSAGLLLAAVVGFGALAATGVLALQQQRHAADQVLALERARLAAQAGLQWGRWQAACASAPACAAATTLAPPGALSAWRVTVRCTPTGTHVEGVVTRQSFRIEATACNAAACPGAPSASYVEAVAADWVTRP